jgi:hypothetical protein
MFFHQQELAILFKDGGDGGVGFPDHGAILIEIWASQKFKVLMEQLAIPLGHQTTVTKWMVISKTRREQKNRAPHMRS